MKQSLWWTIVIALILAGCPLPNAPEQPEQPEAPASGAGQGLVRLMLGSGNGRTLMPAVPVFAKYNLLFTPTAGPATDTVTMNDVPAEEYIDVELLAGTWSVAVTASTVYDLDGSGTFESSEYYVTATGSASGVVVSNGGTVDVTITLTPIAPGTSSAPQGIFTYKITLPEGVTGAITLTPVGTGTAPTIPALTSDAEVSIEMAAGYYDMVIRLTRTSNNTMGGVYSAVHIYPGMETQAEYTFTGADLVSTVNLAGTISNGEDEMTVTAYSDAARTTLLATFTLDNGSNEWLLSFPFAPGTTAYFTISDGTTTRNVGYTGATAIPQNGRSGITLWFPCFYVSQGGSDTAGTGRKDNPFGSVQRAVSAVNTAYTSGNWPAGESALINISGTALTTTVGTNGLVDISSGSTVYPPITLKGYNNGTYTAHSVNAADLNKRALYIAGGANVTLDNLTLTGGSTTNGGGVYVTSSTLTMSSGTISGNTASTNGGGVYVTGSSTFNMTGGIIGGTTSAAQNNGESGAGVFISDGTFAMSGTAAIRNNVSTGGGASSGGGVYVSSATFTMSGTATISENTMPGYGGGVALAGTSAFTMSGSATISGNTAGQYGGGVTMGSTSAFTMSDTTTISGNTATTGGGGVYVNTSAEFTMSGGIIRDNTAKFAGGVYAKNAGVFTMDDGTISGNTATETGSDNGGGGVYCYDTATFTMNGGTISNNTATGTGAENGGGGVYWKSTGTGTMSSGTISGNTVANSGGGVYVATGTFTMSGGTIGGATAADKNTATGNGGGVYVNAGTFTFSAPATISNNTAASGGGVYWNKNDTFTMSSGTISNNTATTSGGGGGVCIAQGTFAMSGTAVISGNSAPTTGNAGGGVFVAPSAMFNMSGGSITGNTPVSNNGGGVHSQGTFTMSGTATISGNATPWGGGVIVAAGTFTMTGGTISGNGSSSADGGGVFMANYPTFNMSGGTISNNTAANGGGIHIASGTITMSDGTITGNTATGTGAGVNGGAFTTFTMSGSAVIAQNNDVHLPSGKVITISGALSLPSGSAYAARLTPSAYPATETVDALTVATGGTTAQIAAAAPLFTVTPSGTTPYYVDAEGKIRCPAQTALISVPAGSITGSSAYVSGTYTGAFIDGRTVTLSAYSAATYETTYELWYAVRQWADSRVTNPYIFANKGKEGSTGTTAGAAPTAAAKTEPIVNISWQDIIAWCNAYSELAGLTPVYSASGAVIRNSSNAANAVMTLTNNGYRLPTEAEWENAARGGVGATNYAYRWAGTDTDTELATYAWYNNNDGSYTKPVGGKTSNSLGLFDMTGNVCEWCWDSFVETLSTDTDPTGPSTGSSRVQRGGSGNNTYLPWLSLAFRGSCYAADAWVGFRVVRSGP